MMHTQLFCRLSAHSFAAIVYAALSLPSYAATLDAQEESALGLYAAQDFDTVQGTCSECKTIAPAMWYFRHEWMAVPKPHMPMATYSDARAALNDLDGDIAALPGLIWLGSSQVIAQATISQDAQHLELATGESLEFAISPKIATNLSYWNEDTLQFLQPHALRMRGELKQGRFIARTVWPLDFKLDLAAKTQALAQNESLKSLVQFEHGGAQSAYSSRLLWSDGNAVQGKAAIAFILDGAQGDDDEAHGGHFAVATGRMDASGSYANWLVNNYYNLARNSEKGIIAGITPLDKYLADLNNGQNFYRPSYMLVAVLRDDKTAREFQSATNRIYNHFYRNDFVYDHSRDNCAGISIDTLRALGWHIPTRGVESQLKAIAAYFYVSISEKSLSKGRAIYDYLDTESTRLLPAVAFDAIGEDLLKLAKNTNLQRSLSPYETQLKQDISAIYFVRIPQIPSSRAFGLAPVYSFAQYMQQAPADHSQWKIIPTTANPLPDKLKTAHAVPQPSLVPWPVALLVLLLCLILGLAARKLKNILVTKSNPPLTQ